MGYTIDTGMFELEPQIVDLDRSLLFKGKIMPWRINVLGQICGPGEDAFNFFGISGAAYLIRPLP